ncbi:hypothetical protein [Methylobacterium brachythecii]|uniref:Uncharacterized protein n=1 Tax=Methylobacterium brachythecii TaxID=1176177 RepID=A0ABQ6D8T9_9HYPH|nr:hypothetical protein [Methylobacterium brachythecii]GLS46567.1 hypothetical protein GCM10007884_45610 [Methylobacterium brachythecii]
MIRNTKVEETALDTPEAISDHLHAEFERRQTAALFKLGERVRIINRSSIPPEVMVGDVGTVMLCDPEFSPLTTLMGVNDQVMTIQFPVQTANLERVEA